MKRSRKNFLSLALALVMTLSLAAPVFATDTTIDNSKNKAEFTVTSTLNLPTISVTISTPAGIVVNPYGMKYDASGVGLTATETATLIAAPGLITNNSNISMKVVATPTVTKQADAAIDILTTKPAAGSEITKPSVFLQFSVGNADDTNKAKEQAQWSNTKTIVVEPTGSTAQTAEVTLGEKTSTSATYAGYQFGGGSYGLGWTAADKFDVNLIFDVTPVVNAGT